MRYVIVGNSAAGIGAVEGIRKTDAQGEITIISSEPHHTYARPLISYYLSGKIRREQMHYRSTAFYKENRCRLLAGKTVTAIDAAQKSVQLDDGSCICYDKLLIAAGSRAVMPPIEGLGSIKSAYTFLSLDDAQSIKADPNSRKHVLILGAGLIGLKCAEALHGLASHITVVDMAPQILSSILDVSCAARVQQHMEAQGIAFRLNSRIVRFAQRSACLHDGTVLPFDLLVLAAGVAPNTALLRGIAEIDKGILIDEASRTSAHDIYAAGDCVQALDISSGERKIMALLPNAYMQGECAGIHMAGGQAAFHRNIPMNSIGFFGLHIMSAGSYTGEVYEAVSAQSCKRLFFSGNRLNGFILAGNVDKAGIYTSMIREQTPLDSIDFALVAEQPGLMAFSRQERTKKLGGAV